jgi:hypothetical protein
MVLTAFTALAHPFDVWEAPRISPYDFNLIPAPAQPRQRTQKTEQNKPTNRHDQKQKLPFQSSRSSPR